MKTKDSSLPKQATSLKLRPQNRLFNARLLGRVAIFSSTFEAKRHLISTVCFNSYLKFGPNLKVVFGFLGQKGLFWGWGSGSIKFWGLLI